MRGGAIPVLAWGTILLVLLAINWIWTGDAVQVGEFALAVSLVYGAAALFAATRREALRRGPPEPRADIEPLPQGSLSAVLIGLSVACIGFGVVWSRFLVYFGVGVLVMSAGRLVNELRAERSSLREQQP